MEGVPGAGRRLKEIHDLVPSVRILAVVRLHALPVDPRVTQECSIARLHWVMLSCHTPLLRQAFCAPAVQWLWIGRAPDMLDWLVQGRALLWRCHSAQDQTVQPGGSLLPECRHICGLQLAVPTYTVHDAERSQRSVRAGAGPAQLGTQCVQMRLDYNARLASAVAGRGRCARGDSGDDTASVISKPLAMGASCSCHRDDCTSYTNELDDTKDAMRRARALVQPLVHTRRCDVHHLR